MWRSNPAAQLSQIFVLANEFKEGDLNVGGTRDDHIRREARNALAALPLGDIARAVEEIASLVDRILAERCSGVALTGSVR